MCTKCLATNVKTCRKEGIQFFLLKKNFVSEKESSMEIYQLCLDLANFLLDKRE